MVTALLAEGADPTWQSKAGETPLHIAVRYVFKWVMCIGNVFYMHLSQSFVHRKCNWSLMSRRLDWLEPKSYTLRLIQWLSHNKKTYGGSPERELKKPSTVPIMIIQFIDANEYLALYLQKTMYYIVACQGGRGLQRTAKPLSRDETRSVNPLVLIKK